MSLTSSKASVPVTILTGFLGAGKSTLVNRLLRELPSRRFGMVVNEFGDSALESQLIESRKQPLFELPAGCLCCVSDGDLEAALKSLVQKDGRVGHILVEASGLSSPGPLVSLLTSDRPVKEFPFHLGAVFCVVDASTFLQREPAWPAVHRQLAFADAVFLAKTDLCAPETVQVVRQRLTQRYPGLTCHSTDKALPWGVLFEQKDHGPEGLAPEPVEKTPASGRRFFQSSTVHEAQVFEYSTDKPLSAQGLRDVFAALGEGILRAKGVVYLRDRSSKAFKYIVQYTGAQRQLYSRRWQKGEARRTNLIFLGTEFDAEHLQKQLDACTEGATA